MFKIEIDTDNEAFTDKAEEVARILREIAKKLVQGSTGGNARDYNGNTVGSWVLK